MDRHPGALIGLFVGVVLGIAGALGGFSAFIIVLVCGVVGTGVGLVLDGTLDLSGVLGPRGRDRLDR